MNQKEIKELIEFLIDKDIAEFELERGDVKLRVRRGNATSSAAALAPAATTIFVPTPQPTPTPVPSTAASAVAAAGASPASTPMTPAAPAGAVAEPVTEEALEVVRSPIVGTFYEAPSPGAPPFVKPGDRVSVGQVLCIVEAMKLMNEIESDFAGVIVKKFVENAQPVEYGQPLFAIRP